MVYEKGVYGEPLGYALDYSFLGRPRNSTATIICAELIDPSNTKYYDGLLRNRVHIPKGALFMFLKHPFGLLGLEAVVLSPDKSKEFIRDMGVGTPAELRGNNVATSFLDGKLVSINTQKVDG